MKMRLLSTYRKISLIMALLIFISSSGFAIDIHFCNGHVKRAAIYGKAKSCTEVDVCQHSKVENEFKNLCGVNDGHEGCCSNKSIILDLDLDATDGETYSDQKTENKQPSTIQKMSLCCLNKLKFSLNNPNTYIVPYLKKNVLVLFQVFLL